jgi:hypothetical protein
MTNCHSIYALFHRLFRPSFLYSYGHSAAIWFYYLVLHAQPLICIGLVLSVVLYAWCSTVSSLIWRRSSLARPAKDINAVSYVYFQSSGKASCCLDRVFRWLDYGYAARVLTSFFHRKYNVMFNFSQNHRIHWCPYLVNIILILFIANSWQEQY